MITTSYKNYYVIITYILTYIIFERLLKVTKTERTTGLFNPSMSSVQRAKSPVGSGSDVYLRFLIYGIWVISRLPIHT